MTHRTGRIGLSVLLLLITLGTGAPQPWTARSGGELLPDLAMAPLRDFRIEWVGGRRLLRFTAMMVNLGPGHMEVRGYRSSTSEPMQVDQVTYVSQSRSEADVARRFPTGAIAQYAGDGHDHWHVTEMMRYDLWGEAAVVEDEKVGFCFLDSDRYFGSSASYYRGSWCSTDPNALSNRMGISVGWGDLYAWNFGLQWVDITNAPSGTFFLRATTDPYTWFTETNDGNQCTTVSLSWTAQSNAVSVINQEPECWSDWGSTEFAADIEWAFAAGVTEGCSYNLFCPRHAVSREEMASFIKRTLNLDVAWRDYFWDDNGSIHEDDINRLAEHAITNGCGGGAYCPHNGVTRQEMASFIARAWALPAAEADYFSDDNGSIHEADINRVAQAGITVGCGGSNFCPFNVVSRGEMAAFLHRAVVP